MNFMDKDVPKVLSAEIIDKPDSRVHSPKKSWVSNPKMLWLLTDATNYGPCDTNHHP